MITRNIICLTLLVFSTLSTPLPAQKRDHSSVVLLPEQVGSSPLQEPTLRMFSTLVASLANKTPHSAGAKARSVRLFSALYQLDNTYLHEVLSIFVHQLRSIMDSVLLPVRTRDKHLILLLEETKHVIKAMLAREQISYPQQDIDQLMEELYTAISPTLKSFWLRMVKLGAVTAVATLGIYAGYRLLARKNSEPSSLEKALHGPYELGKAIQHAPVAHTINREFERSNKRYERLLKQHGFADYDDVNDDEWVWATNDAGMQAEYALSRVLDKNGNPLKEEHTKEDRMVIRTPLNLADALIQLCANPDSPVAQLSLQIARELDRVNDADDANQRRFNIDPKNATRVIIKGPSGDILHEPLGSLPKELREEHISSLPQDSKERHALERERAHVIQFQITCGLIEGPEFFDEDRVVPPHAYGLGYGLARALGDRTGHVAKLAENIGVISEKMSTLFDETSDIKTVVKGLLKDKEVVQSIKAISQELVDKEALEKFITDLLTSLASSEAFKELAQTHADGIRVFRWGGGGKNKSPDGKRRSRTPSPDSKPR